MVHQANSSWLRSLRRLLGAKHTQDAAVQQSIPETVSMSLIKLLRGAGDRGLSVNITTARAPYRVPGGLAWAVSVNAGTAVRAGAPAPA